MRDLDNGRPVGRVVGLWRYPVKSMAAEPLAEVDVSWHGFGRGSSLGFRPRRRAAKRLPLAHTSRTRGHESLPFPPSSILRNRTSRRLSCALPSGVVFDVTDPALATELCPQGARVIKQNQGIFDTFPLSLITTQTIARLGETVGAALDVQRFRPEHPGAGRRRRSLPGGRLGRLRAADRRHGDACRQARRSLRRDHDRSRDHAAQSCHPAQRRSRSSGLPRRLRLNGHAGPHSSE